METTEIKARLKKIFIFFLACYFIGSCSIYKAQADENDTATIENILPNAGTTSSSRDAFDLDGVKTGSNAALTNNSTHNGFTITCDTQVSNACGHAFTGELEASHDMKVSASGTLVGLTGVDESNNSHTSNQKKLDGGIGLDSYFSVQNCEWTGSAHQCGSSAGPVDSYSLHIKIKDSSGNTLAEMTTTRTDDAGYNANSKKFADSLLYNGVGANSYEWYWKGVDGSESTTTVTRGPNLLGAELNLAFPTDEYEVFTTEEIEELNEALGTTNLDESELWEVISGIESGVEEQLIETGSLSQGMQVELTFEEEKIELQVYTPASTPIETVTKMETAIVELKETKTVETIKKQVIETVQETISAKTETPKETLPMVSKKETVSSTQKEEPKAKVTSAPPGKTVAKQPTKMVQNTHEEKKEKAVEEKKEVKEEKKEKVKKESKIAKKEETEEKESAEEESSSESPTEVSSANTSEQKKIQQKKALVKNIDRVMDKVDSDIKDVAKNLEIKNIIKLEAMASEQASLDLYSKALFYEPKDIYLEQLNIFDNRQIYANVSLASYVKNDKVAIKANTLHKINLKKQRLLKELELLKNGKI
jgi:hypothetical protein